MKNETPDFKSSIKDMESKVLEVLSVLPNGYGFTKLSISDESGMPEDIVTVLLKRLRKHGEVKRIMFLNEDNGLMAGSGYCLNREKKDN